MTARGWFLFSLMGVVWGVPYLMIKVAVDAVSPSMVVFTRWAPRSCSPSPCAKAA
ncbi:hypothetical protein AB0E64_31810 [Streptomyces caelestis]|uniref:EamA domain-containing protein n=1 Tax=Streptomyces caelestis TaxID=36816 RepID=A0A7W9H310_9ACTN|nr:hypothetical protein [Streptomyces caelestis]MBB5794409.1 hypothetical protein [Streptomyces caelestis]GGW30977.1 hypothetical protein GCM10010320_07710 [Streptomyces caelestis]